METLDTTESTETETNEEVIEPTDQESNEETVQSTDEAESALKFDDKDEDPEGDSDKDEGEDGSDEEPAEPTAYEEFTLPESMVMDEAAYGVLEPVMQELKLDQEGSQTLITALATIRQQEALNDASELNSKRHADLAANKESEGSDEAYDAATKDVNRALNQHGSKELFEVLKKNGLDNDPNLFKFMKSVGANLAEDSIIGAGDRQVATRAADRVFGNSD